MFKKLKRKFILTNLLTTTIVLLIAFSAIYLVALGSTYHREFSPMDRQKFPAPEQIQADSFNSEMEQRIETERQASLQTLLITLICTGLAVEIIVAFISLYLAEQSIKPVREAYNAQKEFVANASHEIKTPLAVIQANLEAADIKNNRWIDNVAQKTEDLTNLNNQLLALARSEGVSEEPKLVDTDLCRLIKNIVSAFEPKANEKGVSITLQSEEKSGVHHKLNRQALEQILNIYLDNAIKYGKKNIIITTNKHSIQVFSDGKPMDSDKLSHLFDRFYQSDKNSEGVGLGLAIAKSIADKNDWKLDAWVDKDSRQNVFSVNYD